MKAETQRSLIIALLALIFWSMLEFPTSKDDLTRLWFRVKGGKRKKGKQADDKVYETDIGLQATKKTGQLAFSS